MKCAIITCSEYKKMPFKKSYICEKLILPNIEDEILILNLKYNCEKFAAFKRKNKLLNQLTRFLLKNDILCVHLSGITDCPEFSKLKKHFYVPDGKKIFNLYAPLGTYSQILQNGENVNDINTVFYTKKYTHQNFVILRDFAQYFKNITVVCLPKNDLEKYSENLLNFSGLCINTAQDMSSVKNSDIIVALNDLDTYLKNTTLIDFCKSCKSICLNSAKFFLPCEFNKLLPYFSVFDDVCLQFLAISANSEDNIFSFVSKIGGSFRSLFYKNIN